MRFKNKRTLLIKDVLFLGHNQSHDSQQSISMVDKPHFSLRISPMYPTSCYHVADNYRHRRGLQQTELPVLLQGSARNELPSDSNCESDPDHLLMMPHRLASQQKCKLHNAFSFSFSFIFCFKFMTTTIYYLLDMDIDVKCRKDDARFLDILIE